MLTSVRSGDDLTRSTDEELMTNKAGRELKLIQSLLTGSGAIDKTGKMLTSVRSGDDLTRSPDEELMTLKAGGELGVAKLIQSLPPGSGATDKDGLGNSSGTDRYVSDSLSLALPKLLRSVVSVSLTDGGTIIYTCLGIPIDRKRTCTRVLTSANLVTTRRKKRVPGSCITIQVRDNFNNIAAGCLEHCDFDNGIALVKVIHFLDVCPVQLRHGVEIQTCNELVAIPLIDSGGVNPVKGILTKGSRSFEGDDVLCKAGDGGPLFYGDGNFAGMNLFSDNGRCDFVPRSVIVERLEPFEKMIELRVRRNSERHGPTTYRRRSRLRQQTCIPI